MLKWLLKSKIKASIENELVDSRLVLSSMRLKLQKEGPETTRVYGEGIEETAGLLAQRFKISVPDALEARGLDWRQLDGAARDLARNADTMRQHLKSGLGSVRTEAHKATAGATILYYLYRLRFLTTQADEEQKMAVVRAADSYADFARLMAEIAAGLRDPRDIY